jgi:hypothetical protein
MLWVKKLGYYYLLKEKEQAEDWILILDESISIGQEKLLLIISVRRSELKDDYALTPQKMTPLILRSSKHWTAMDIQKELELCRQKLGNILYAVSDGGSNIRKALSLCGIRHVYDLTHGIAIILEKIYKNDPAFVELSFQMGQARLKYCCTELACLMPPNQRTKSRFLNIDIIPKWGKDAIRVLKNKDLSDKAKEMLSFIQGKEGLIEELSFLINIIESISILLKNNGLSNKTFALAKKILHGCYRTDRMRQFRKLLIKHLENNLQQITRRGEALLCSSDIIESIFGRYKNLFRYNWMTSITNLALIIPALMCPVNEEVVRTAIDFCTVEKIDDWTKKSLCESLASKRKKMLRE